MHASSEAGVERVVHCSTVAVHGRDPTVPTDEAERCAPDTEYAATKSLSEEIVREQGSRHGIAWVIARPTSTMGPGDAGYASFFRDVLAGALWLVAGGTGRFHVSYVCDVAGGLALCGEERAPAATTYIIGTDEGCIRSRTLFG
jgi:dihydroflavonol-4-reductase